MKMNFLLIDWAGAFNVIGFSFLMVFCLLILIIAVLTISGKLFTSVARNERAQQDRKIREAYDAEETKRKKEAASAGMTGEIAAAIGLALHDYYADVHDIESNIITIEKSAKRYSPWSSKIYGLNVFRR